MHKNTWEGHFLKIFKKCEVFFTQKVVFFQVFGWCFGLVFLGLEVVFWAHDVLATLTPKHSEQLLRTYGNLLNLKNMKSLISKKRLMEEERRRKQSLDSPQTIEANKKHVAKVST